MILGDSSAAGYGVHKPRETPGALRMPPPELGQHTEEVLLDVLGYDWDKIGELQNAGAII